MNHKQHNLEQVNIIKVNRVEKSLNGENENTMFLLPWQKIKGYLILSLTMFLFLIVPVWWEASDVALQRDAAQRELRLSQMQNTLANAVIEAQRGEYEPSRQTLNEFFNLLQDQINAGESSGLLKSQRENLKPLLSERDELLDMLAHGDETVNERMQNFFASYRQAINNTNVTGNDDG